VVIDAYKEAINRADKAIRALADDARIKLKDGSYVTGAHLKELWAKTDFVINPKDSSYLNGTERGEAKYNGGDPVISANIDLIADYGRHSQAGLNYLVLHEVGHLTSANRAFDYVDANPQHEVEQMANDIARAITHAGRISILAGTDPHTPWYGYSTPDPLVFTVPGS
jgi:hypothetical protein